MRHRRHFRRLNRTAEHRLALRRNLAQSFIEHGQITTTIPKAKTVRPYLERLITIAVRARKLANANDQAGLLSARRTIHKLLNDRLMIPAEHRADYNQMSDTNRAKALRMSSGKKYRTGEPKGRLNFTAESVTHRLLNTMAAHCADRPGGYTRLIRLGDIRLGDAAPLATLQLVGNETAPHSLTKPKKSARKLRADSRYALAVKTTKAWTAKGRAPSDGGAVPAGE